ncbi:OLC1v1022686C1 [Oldenlandia corymbosa var. corymbosa]|uniref:OLC1v1022686C1 n=1 Tax=Oldenlandia corymbosa var. corymbosa TaxID=529605 RepID=A0AAV1C0T2_OLDCO|nr:OLC1v1022686C1 [Oldenlandia corymbosa var. corymbosa]
MDKFKFFQILKLSVMVILLCITPFLSASLRPPYIYFIVNLLIIALGAEAGLLPFLFKSTESDNKTSTTTSFSTLDDHNVAAQKPGLVSSEDTFYNKEKTAEIATGTGNREGEKPAKAVEKSSSEKVVIGQVAYKVVRKSPSMPSLFFIGDDQVEEVLIDHDQLIEEGRNADDYEEGEDGDDDHEINGQELFHQAETFIGNFHKHLRMQREDSWNKLQELCHQAF